jgi:octaprenyl-diphosphate synthase
MTLPLIHALSKASWTEKRKIIGIVKNESTKPKKVKEVIAFVKASGGIEYATQSMNQFHQQATEILDELPASVYKSSLEQLVKFTIERRN